MNWRWNGEDPFDGTAIDGPRGGVWRRVLRAVGRRWADAHAHVVVAGPLGLAVADALVPDGGTADGRSVGDAAADAPGPWVPDEQHVRAALSDGRLRSVSGAESSDGAAALLLPLHGPGGTIAVLRVARPAGFGADERDEAADLAHGVTARLIARRYALRARLADALATLPGAAHDGSAVAMAALSELVGISGASAGTILVDRGGTLRSLADYGKDAIARKARMQAGIPYGTGVAWGAVREGRARFVTSYPERVDAIADMTVDPHLFVLPIGRQKVPRWVLLLAFADDDPPSDDALALVEESGALLAAVLELAATAEVDDRLTELLERMPDVPAGRLPQAILEVATASVPGVDSGAIAVSDGTGRRFRVRASVGYALADDDGPDLTDEALRTWYAPEHRSWHDRAPRILTLPASSAWLRLARRVGHRPRADLDAFWREVRTDLTVPVAVDGEVRAVLTLHARTREDAFDRDSTRVARQVAATASVALRIAADRERSRREAVTDALTGILNRRGAETELARALARAERAGRPLALVMIDLGSFKRINDRHGHDAGDRALRQVADALRSGVRAGDAVARWGGDEFLVLLPHQTAEEAEASAERLLAALHAVRAGDVRLEAHAGVAAYPDDATDADTLVRTADGRMYATKRAR